MRGSAFYLIAEEIVEAFVLVTSEASLLHCPISDGNEEWVLSN